MNRAAFLKLAVLLAFSYALRILLTIWKGGPTFWPDEGRYTIWPLASAHSVATGGGFTLLGAVYFCISGADHAGFKLLGLIPAFLQQFLKANNNTAAAFFSLFSTFNIAWVYLIARRFRLRREPSFLAAALAAGTNVMFYYSRHLMPYDTALFFGLAAIWLVAQGRALTVVQAFVAGFCAFFCAFTYMGFWSFTLLVPLIYLLQVTLDHDLRRSFRQHIRNYALMGLGVLAPVGLLVYLSHSTNGKVHYFASAGEFSKTVVQGEFSEGWKLPWEYFYAAERGTVVLWLVALFFGFARLRFRQNLQRAQVISVAAVVFIYGLLVVASNGLEKFVVYGRLAKPLTPFLCILTAVALWEWALFFKTKTSYRRYLLITRVAAALWLGQTVYNFADTFGLTFPNVATAQAQELVGGQRLLLANSFTALNKVDVSPAAPTDYWLFNSGHLYGFDDRIIPWPAGKALFTYRHPLTFEPYLYEGYLPADRERLKKYDYAIRLIKK